MPMILSDEDMADFEAQGKTRDVPRQFSDEEMQALEQRNIQAAGRALKGPPLSEQLSDPTAYVAGATQAARNVPLAGPAAEWLAEKLAPEDFAEYQKRLQQFQVISTLLLPFASPNSTIF